MSQTISLPPKRGAARCPKYSNCSAPICPLDNWQRAQHLRGERVCLLLREAVKPGGGLLLVRAVGQQLASTVADALPEIEASSSDIRHKLSAAAVTGSKIAGGDALRGRAQQSLAETFQSEGSPRTAYATGGGSGIV